MIAQEQTNINIVDASKKNVINRLRYRQTNISNDSYVGIFDDVNKDTFINQIRESPAYKKLLELIPIYLEKRKTLNNKSSSYGIKHIIEDLTGLYSDNDQFIIAMVDLGFSYKQTHVNSPNYYFNYKYNKANCLTKIEEKKITHITV